MRTKSLLLAILAVICTAALVTAALRSDPFNAIPDVPWDRNGPTQVQTWQKYESASTRGRMYGPFVYPGGGLHGVSASLVSPTFATEAYVPERVNQVAVAITYGALAADVCWTIVSSTNAAITNWTRVNDSAGVGTAYYYRCQGSTTPIQPALPANSAWLMQVTISSSSITSVTDLRKLGYPIGGVPIESYTSFTAAVNAWNSAGNPNVTMSLGSRIHVIANTTITSNITLAISPGGLLDIDSGVTLTFNMCPAAGDYRIFAGTGTVTFAADAMCAVKAAWWGVAPSASAANNATWLQAALNAGAAEVDVGRGTYSHDTVLNLPANVWLRCQSAATILSYTGTGNAIAMNSASAGTTSVWRGKISDCRITTTTGAAGIYYKDVTEVWIERNSIDGFSNAGILADSTNVTGASFSIRIMGNMIKTNGRGIRLIGGNNHNQYMIMGNRIQGSTTGPGIQADIATKSTAIIGNDIEGNTNQEILFANGFDGMLIQGNHFETNAGSNAGITLQGAAPYRGATIQGNFMSNNGASASGRALYMSGNAVAPAYTGIVFSGNEIIGYGVGSNCAIDFNGGTFAYSDFHPNFFGTGVTQWCNRPAVTTSQAAVVRRFQNVFQNITFDVAIIPAQTSTSVDLAMGLATSDRDICMASPLRTNNAIGVIANIESGLVWSAHVKTAGFCTVRVANVTNASITPIARDWLVVLEGY